MAWTYDTELTEDKDAVRILIGDTNDRDPQLTNEEINALLAAYGTVQATAVAACRILAAKYSREADKWVGDLKILASQKAEAYLKLAEELAAAGSAAFGALSGVPTAGGISIAQKEAMEENADRVVPFFKRGMHDNQTVE